MISARFTYDGGRFFHRYFFSPAARAMVVAPDGWELMHTVSEWTVLRQRDAAAELKRTEKRLRKTIEKQDDDMMVDVDEEHVREARAVLEKVRREKKELFANLFAGACGALAEHLADASAAGRPASEAMSDEWWLLAHRRTCAAGRAHQREVDLATVEMVVEGNDVCDEVRDAVFGPLRQLERHLR